MIIRKINQRFKTRTTNCPALNKLALLGTLALVAVASLSGCNTDTQASPTTKVAQPLPLAKVNDVEIAMLQPAANMAPAAGQSTAKKEADNKQLLEMLIDRQLLQEAAVRNKLDRDPQVIQAIDRAKTEILAQAYLQHKFAAIGAPSNVDIDVYFKTHPELFTQRKLFYMKELVVATKDFSAQLKASLDSAKSIEQVATWLDKNHVPYERTQVSRSTADLAPEMVTKLQAMGKNQLFIIKSGEYTMVDFIYEVKPSPVTAEAAGPQIASFLQNKKREEIGEAELGRLRASAKVEYLHKKNLAATPAIGLAASDAAIQTEHGMTGRK